MTKVATNVELGRLTFVFNDGSEETFLLSDLSEKMHARLSLHGLTQKLRDSYASRPAEAYEQVMGVWESLLGDNWTRRGEAVSRVTVLVRAILRINPDLEESAVSEKVKALSKADRKTLEAEPSVAAAMAEIKAEDAAARAEAAKKKAGDAKPIDIGALLG
jgi:hypothetical protein